LELCAASQRGAMTWQGIAHRTVFEEFLRIGILMNFLRSCIVSSIPGAAFFSQGPAVLCHIAHVLPHELLGLAGTQ
jgi:hypothetical protein